MLPEADPTMMAFLVIALLGNAFIIRPFLVTIRLWGNLSVTSVNNIITSKPQRFNRKPTHQGSQNIGDCETHRLPS